MSPSTEHFVESFDRMLEEDGPAIAMSIITGSFVSLVISYSEHRGFNTDCDIKIDGGENRDITIHAPKGVKQ